MSEIPRELLELSARVYAARRWPLGTPTPGAMRMRCADCGAAVSVTPAALAESRRQAHAAGRSLAVVCDDCAIEEGVQAGAMVAMLAPNGPAPMSDEAAAGS